MLLLRAMTVLPHAHVPSRGETRFILALFLVSLGFHSWAVFGVGWESNNLPGFEFRQAQTALSTFYIKLENNFSPAYPTPVLGKPWSIPMEFPLYQWTVVAVSKVTGLGLTKAARTVSIACFYLALPALYLLLARWQVAPGRRWLVLALVLTCPLYIFYTRAFLMETMALMFALWFWVGFERAVAERSYVWLYLAILAGTGAGLVKVTTFMLYSLPVGLWAANRLWQARAGGRWRTELTWMVAAVFVPLAATWWWVRFADATKALNPMAYFLRSENMMGFNFGTTQTRFSPEMWAMKGRIVREKLTWFPALAGCAVLALGALRTRWREIFLCTGVFAAALLVFPVLYALHDYYYVANMVLLSTAMGLVLVALAESARPRWMIALVITVVTSGQIYHYFSCYYAEQEAYSPGGSGLTESLRAFTLPEEYLIVTGYDWNSMIPYYAQRRAFMIRDDVEKDFPRLDQEFALLANEKPGALLMSGPWEKKTTLLQKLSALGFETKPLYVWHDISIFVPVGRREEILGKLERRSFYEVKLAPGVEFPKEKLAGTWFEVANLRPRSRWMFHAINPEPVRCWSTYGPGLDERNGHTAFGGHPITRLVFQLPAGLHKLRTTLELPRAAYAEVPDISQRTDGVEITLFVLGPGDERSPVFTRLFDPVNNVGDRGTQPLEIEFTLAEPSEVELFFGPGPNGRDTRDWITMGQLVID